MTAPFPQAHQSGMLEMAQQLSFAQRLQALTNKVHATGNLDQILYDLGRDICELFEADRITLYLAEADGRSIVSRLKTGLNQFKEIRLPVGPHSIAGFCALARQVLNIHDVYDAEELKRFSPHIKFLDKIDQATGYRSRQMLVSPVLDPDTREVLAVVQLINTRHNRPFAALAEEGMIEFCKTLAIALKQRSVALRPQHPLYDGLVSAGLISEQTLRTVIKTANESGAPIEEILIEQHKVPLDAIGRSMASFYGVEYEPFRRDRVKPSDLLRNFKRDTIELSGWMPIDETPEGVVVMSADLGQIIGTKAVTLALGGRKVVYRVTTRREFAQTLDQFFESGDLGEMLLRAQGEEDSGEEVIDVTAAADSEVVQLVNKIILDAHKAGASDIHIEPAPGKNKTLIRFRKDGALQRHLEIPSSFRAPIVARIKIMCDLDIAERRLPQDGKIKFSRFAPLDVELRVATCPTQGGVEDVVMRILAQGEPLPLDKMSFSKRNETALIECVSKPYGLFFVCGPTGSGKTTTLHSVLKFLNNEETKIWTAEDPVEITQKGLRQVQMNPKAGLTFATAMRAFLRADPDIIMVGEMRDAETAGMGIEASLTGHLVLSTLHTNSAPETIIRLMDMGMDPFNFADALLGILAQRLARRLCPKCRMPHALTPVEVEGMLSEYSADMIGPGDDPAAVKARILEEWMKNFARDGKLIVNVKKEGGCPECDGKGYKGRIGLHELLVGTDGIKKLIQEKARVAELRLLAINEGMRTLKQDGMEKVLQGHTDMFEVRAVCVK